MCLTCNNIEGHIVVSSLGVLPPKHTVGGHFCIYILWGGFVQGFLYNDVLKSGYEFTILSLVLY